MSKYSIKFLNKGVVKTIDFDTPPITVSDVKKYLKIHKEILTAYAEGKVK